MTDTKAYFQAKQDLQHFLEENPHFKKKQKEIDLFLNSAGCQHNRCVFIQIMMADSLNDLKLQIQKLNKINIKA
jgi:hypothetical protein